MFPFLFQVARRGAKYGMLAPKLIQFEEEIDAELAGEEPAEPAAQRVTCDLMSLDEMVSTPWKCQRLKTPVRRRIQMTNPEYDMVRSVSFVAPFLVTMDLEFRGT